MAGSLAMSRAVRYASRPSPTAIVTARMWALPCLGGPLVRNHASVQRRWRQAVCRLRGRRRPGGHRPADREAAQRLDLRRRPRRLEFYTRRRPGPRGSPTGSAVTLAPSRRSAVRRRWWRRTTPRGHQGVLLRSADQPQLRRDGGALRRSHARPCRPREGQSRAGGVDDQALASRPTAPSRLLQLGRRQRGDRRSAPQAQRGTADPAARRNASSAARGDRSPALKAVPTPPYVFAEWRIRRVSIDYHLEVETHYYSVPHRFDRAEVEVQLTARTVERSSSKANRSPPSAHKRQPQAHHGSYQAAHHAPQDRRVAPECLRRRR